MRKIWIRDPAISDHQAIRCELNLRKPAYAKKMVQFRKLRCVNLNCFPEDILASPLLNQPSSDLQSLVSQYKCFAVVARQACNSEVKVGDH